MPNTFFTQTAARAAYHAAEAAEAARQLVSDLASIGGLPAEKLAKQAAELLGAGESILSLDLLKLSHAERKGGAQGPHAGSALDTRSSPPAH